MRIVLEGVGEFVPQPGDEAVLANFAVRLPGLTPKDYLVGLYLLHCVEMAKHSVTRTTSGEHVSALEILSVAEVGAASVFGENAKAWLTALGLTSSGRLGEAVSNLVSHHVLGIAEHDRIEDFNVHSDFDEYISENT